MAEYSANAAQNIAASGNAIFTETPIPSSGLIFHRDESGVFRLASPAKIIGKLYGGCPCNRQLLEALYSVTFHGNIAIPTGGTVEEISLAIAIDGSVDPSSTMIVTPAAVGDFWNVGAEIIVAVPSICGCESISVVNTSTQAITLQNANLTIEYVGIKI